MARGFSKAIICGNLTRDPELKTTTNGATVCTFSVAVNRTFKDSSGTVKEAVSYIDCSAWSKPGEIIAQYAKKGTGIMVSGRLDQRSWETPSGERRSRVEIVVEDFNFIGGTNRDGGNNNQHHEAVSNTGSGEAEYTPEDVPEEEIDLSEIPF